MIKITEKPVIYFVLKCTSLNIWEDKQIVLLNLIHMVYIIVLKEVAIQCGCG